MKRLQKKAKTKKADSFSFLFKHYFFRLKSFKGLKNFCFFLFGSLFGYLVKFILRRKKNFVGKTNILLFLNKRYLWLILPIEDYEDLIKFPLGRKKNFIGKISLFLKRKYVWLILKIEYGDCEELDFEEA